jgi:hypothetical protein
MWPTLAPDNYPVVALTLDDVTSGAVAALATYPKIGSFLDEHRIKVSTEANWPDAPAPLVFWLWMSQSELLGRIPTASLLAGLEGMLRALEVDKWVTGDWRGRFKKLVPPRDKSGFDHYSNFRSALFELNLSFRLVCSSAVTIQPDGPTRGCDLLIGDTNGPVAEVEVYAPQRGVREMYNQELVTNWSMLVGGDPVDLLASESDEAVRSSLNSTAVVDALDDFLKVGNFANKRKQLAAAQHPSLLAIRAFGLTTNLAEVATTPRARDFAGRIDPMAWDELPDSCLGLLFSLQGDIVNMGSPLAAVISPNRQLPRSIGEYLRRCGALHEDQIEA